MKNSHITRKYGSLDLLRFVKFSKKHPRTKPLNLLKKYHKENPELSEKQKLANLLKALKFKDNDLIDIDLTK